jgi:transposase
MAAPRKYPDELRERATQMAVEARRDPATRTGALRRIGDQLGINPETLRNWVTQAEIDGGDRPGTTTSDAQRLAELERENRELRRANAILKSASVKSTGQRNTFTILEVCGGEAGPAGHERPVARAVMGDVGCRKVVQRDFEGDRLSAWFDLHGDQTNRGLRSGAA